MREIIFLVAGIATAFGIGSASAAERIPPWCLEANTGRGSSVDLCYFYSWQRCYQERFLYPNTSFCIVNPAYYFRYGEPPPDRTRPRRNATR
jgi:hypothetical protein